MSYIRCGQRGCDFSQDDWWSLTFKPQWKFWRWSSVFGYNPITMLLENSGDLLKPRWVRFDAHFARQIESEHGFKIRLREVHKEEPIQWGDILNINEKYGDIRSWNEIQAFSWSLLRWEVYRAWLKIRKMKWYTFKQYKNDPYKLCPRCNHRIPDSMID